MLERHTHATRQALAAALAEAVARDLEKGLAERGQAALAVSGGSTPTLFFKQLSKASIDWANNVITLVDERWVDEGSDRSNARLVRENLMQNNAAAATFVPLFSGGQTLDEAAVARTTAQLQTVPHPFDAVVLGMGNDGHTASFFPQGDTLDLALTSKGPAVAIRAPGAGEPRITLTLPYLAATHSLYLHIEGAQKAATLEKALCEGPAADMPVRAVLRQQKSALKLFWAP